MLAEKKFPSESRQGLASLSCPVQLSVDLTSYYQWYPNTAHANTLELCSVAGTARVEGYSDLYIGSQ